MRRKVADKSTAGKSGICHQQEITRKVAGMFEDAGRKLSGMVKIPTVSGKGHKEEYHIEAYRKFLKKEFAEIFAIAEEIPVGEARLLRLPGNGSKGGKPVLFTGHMDVVPAVDGKDWKYPPFSGEIAEERVWGRGAQDMKGPQCALLMALDGLLKEGWRPKREVWLYLSCDEETGGETTETAASLLRQKGISFAVVFDEGGTICENFMGLVAGKAAVMAVGEKGSLEYRFTALAQGGHSAAPPKHSAIVRLGALMCEIEGTDIFRRNLSTGGRAMLRAAAECLPAEDERRKDFLTASMEEGDYPVLHKICPQAESLLGSTIAFTMIEGGTAFNVMPRKAVLTANVRVSALETKEEVTERLTAVAKKHDLLCEFVGGKDAVRESDTRQPGYQMMKACVNQVYPGLPVIPFVLGGGTDSRHFQELTEEIVRFSPMYAEPWQGRGVHGDNEAANIEAVQDAARCYRALLLEL